MKVALILPDCWWVDPHRLIETHHQVLHAAKSFVSEATLKKNNDNLGNSLKGCLCKHRPRKSQKATLANFDRFYGSSSGDKPWLYN